MVLGHQFSPNELLPLLHSPHLLILGEDIRNRPNGRDGKLVDLLMTLCIMLLDMLEISRLPERRYIPVQLAHPAMNSGVPGANIANITLKMLDIHRVKADNGREEPDISLGDGGAKVEGRLGALRSGEVGFDLVEGGEKRCYGSVVGFLGGREAGFVDAVVDVVVGPFVGGFDLGSEGLWVEIDFFVGFGKDVVEFVVKHADDFGALDRFIWSVGIFFFSNHFDWERYIHTSLLTTWFAFLSKSTGTVNRPLYAGSCAK